MAKILHVADVHLDGSYSTLTHEKARERRADMRELFVRMVQYANDQKVDLFLIAGDLFSSHDIYAETSEMVVEACRSFEGQMVIVPGNHDYYAGESPYAKIDWPDNVYIFKKQELESIEFAQYGCVVYGKAFTAPYDNQPFEDIIPENEKASILLLHGDLDISNSKYRTVTSKQLSQCAVDYVALGHVHQRSEIYRFGNCCGAYAGCPEGQKFDEDGEKGFYIGTIEKGRVDLEFMPFAKHRYETLKVDVSEGNPIENILKRIPLNTENDSYRIILCGETEQEISTNKIEEEIGNLFESLSVIDETKLRHDIWREINEDTLRGYFLKEMKTRFDEAEEQDKAVLEQAVRLGLAALEHREL